jgi:predicted MPP superfamily phosphohydrolase
MRALINAFIIHLTLNLLVFLKGWHVFDHKKWARIILILVFTIEFLIYSAGFIFYRNLPENINQFMRVMGTSWMLFLLYSGGIWLITDLVYIFINRNRRKSWRFREQSQRYKISSYIITILFVLVILINGHIKFLNPVVQQIPISINKSAGNLNSIRVAMIGDLHLGWMINREHTNRFVNLIMAQDPDLILFVGDIIDSNIHPIVDQKMNEELARLNAPLGVFSCTGNHEYRYDAEEKIQLLNDAGIIMLRDSVVLIDSSFYIIGREDKVVLDRQSLEDILNEQSVDRTMPLIVLNHTPDNLSEEAKSKVDLALYGHTHHGQAFPGNIATEVVFEVAHGYKKKNNTHFYVTSGLGLVGPQFRIGTVSEIAMININFNN